MYLQRVLKGRKPFWAIKTTLIALTLTLSACDGSRENDAAIASTENLNLALKQVLSNTVIPAVEGFSQAAQGFNNNADSFCTSPSASDLNDLQQAWENLFEQWMRLSNHNFGPLDDDIIRPLFTFIDSLRLRGTNYTATVRTEIANDIAGTHALNTAYFAAKSFNRVGLLALEVAVFETSANGNSPIDSNILAEYLATPRKCEILKGLATQIEQHATLIETSWITNYQSRGISYQQLFLDDNLDDGTAALAQLIISTQENLDYLQKRKVVSTVAQLAGHSWQGLSIVINAVDEALSGTGNTTISFFDVMASTGNSNAANTVKANIASAKQSIIERNELALENSLSLLDGNFKREIPQSLDIELGFNFSDGD